MLCDGGDIMGVDLEMVSVFDPANPGPIGGITPADGTFVFLKGNMDEIIKAVSSILTAVDVKGGIITNFGQEAADNLQALPAAAEGMSCVLICGTAQAAHYFGVQADTDDKIYLDGVAGSDNGVVKIAVPVVGVMVVLFTFKTGDGVYDWYASKVSGDWVAA